MFSSETGPNKAIDYPTRRKMTTRTDTRTRRPPLIFSSVTCLGNAGCEATEEVWREIVVAEMLAND